MSKNISAFLITLVAMFILYPIALVLGSFLVALSIILITVVFSFALFFDMFEYLFNKIKKQL